MTTFVLWSYLHLNLHAIAHVDRGIDPKEWRSQAVVVWRF